MNASSLHANCKKISIGIVPNKYDKQICRHCCYLSAVLMRPGCPANRTHSGCSDSRVLGVLQAGRVLCVVS